MRKIQILTKNRVKKNYLNLENITLTSYDLRSTQPNFYPSMNGLMGYPTPELTISRSHPMLDK